MNTRLNWWQTWRSVFRKEMLDALRDRRTLIVVLLSSVAMGPLVLTMLSTLVSNIEERAEAREIVVQNLEAAPTLRNYLARQTYTVKTAPADWEQQLQRSKLGDPVLVVPDDFEAALSHGEAPRLDLVYSSANNRAQSGVGRLHQLLGGFRQEHITLRLLARGISPAGISVMQVDEHDVADSAARAAQLTGLMPFFVMMAMLYGALNAALDTTAGERERGSLEPLLATPVARSALVGGKWSAVFCLALLISLLSCLSFLPAQWLLRSESLAALFRFGPGEATAFILLLLPLAAALSGLLMAIAIRCKSNKEAQANCSVVLMAMSLMPMFSMFNQDGEAPWHLWTPALGQITLMNRVLKGEAIGLTDALPGLLVCSVLTVLSLGFVARQLRKQAAQ